MNDQFKGCPCCTGRRDFLKTLGLLSGAAIFAPQILTLQSCAGPYTGEKKNALKVRLIYSIWDDVQVVKTWPNVGYDFRPVMDTVTSTLNSNVKDVEFIPGKASDKAGVQAILDQDEQRGDIVGYMVIQMNSWPRAATEIYKMTDKPLLFCSYPYSGIGGWDVTNSEILESGRKGYAFMSSMDFKDTIGAAKAFSKLRKGTADDFVAAATAYRIKHTPAFSGRKAKEGPLKCLSPEETLAKVKGMKLLSLEGAPQREAVMADFGIDVIPVAFEELNDLWFKVSDERAQPLFDNWKKEAKSIQEVNDKTLMDVAKMYFAMDDLLKAYDAQGITISCLQGCYSNRLGAYPCLGFMELQDAGFFGTCENDVESTISMMVASAMTGGRMGYISDPVIDSSTRSIIYAHCVATRKFLGPDSEKVPFEILTHSEDRNGASIRSFAPEGYPVTTFRFSPAAKTVVLHTGITTGNDTDDRACRTKIVAEVNGDFEKIYSQWHAFGWHRVTVYGDFSKDIEALADHLGYKVLWES